MRRTKYQKEYERYAKCTRKAFNILRSLYYEINNDKKLKEKKDISFELSLMEKSMLNYLDMISDMSLIDFSHLKDAPSKEINNLLILPLYQDEDIYADSEYNISDIYNKPKE